MFCEHCGYRMAEGAAFCGSCGRRVSAPGGGAPPPAPSSTPPPGSAASALSAAAREYGPDVASGVAPPGRESPPGSHPPAGAWHETRPAAEYADFGPRFGAWILDVIFATLLGILPGIVLAAIIGGLVAAGQEPAFTRLQQEQQDEDLGVAILIGYWIASGVTSFVYHWIGTATGGAWGKRIVGIRIVRATDGGAPGYGAGFLRVFVSWISALPLYLGYFWALWDSRKQTWHDKAAETVVVRVR
jgi:uncharacterized RDD family membrane protein YckC